MAVGAVLLANICFKLKEGVKKNCALCGEGFIPATHSSKYCDVCKKRAQANNIKKWRKKNNISLSPPPSAYSMSIEAEYFGMSEMPSDKAFSRADRICKKLVRDKLI